MKRSVQQEHTIEMLENQLENHEDRVRFLEKILLEKSPIMSNDDDTNIIDHESNDNIGPLFNHREKRPVRLFPAHMLNGYLHIPESYKFDIIIYLYILFLKSS